MHKNMVWIGFLILFALVTMGYIGLLGYRLAVYWQLQEQVPIANFTSEIVEESDSAYRLIIDYSFTRNDVVFTGKDSISDRPFLNRWAAEQALAQFASKPQKVWINPRDPQHNAINIHFPVREMVYAISLLALLIYFVWLGFYVGRRYF